MRACVWCVRGVGSCMRLSYTYTYTLVHIHIHTHMHITYSRAGTFTHLPVRLLEQCVQMVRFQWAPLCVCVCVCVILASVRVCLYVSVCVCALVYPHIRMAHKITTKLMSTSYFVCAFVCLHIRRGRRATHTFHVCVSDCV